MKTLFELLLALIALLVVGCSSIVDLTTARSVDAIRWEKTVNLGEAKKAQLMDCREAVYCSSPDSYISGSQMVYVWEHEYATLGGMEMFPLFVEVRRPEAHTWDKIALELNNGQWFVGVYGINSWYKEPVGSDFPIAIGMANESWAVVVSPDKGSTFKYEFVPDYWK